ncbi:MAG: DNA-binding protein HU [candidate division Zixibacteria bacterium]|nr:DNA-binding protein HU [candidate division Zixibacteria bacterium]
MKEQLIDKIAADAEITKKQAKTAMESMLEGIKGNLKKGNKITFVGFGTFSVSKRKARTGRNPRTGEPLKIRASKVATFKPGKGLKDALNP